MIRRAAALTVVLALALPGVAVAGPILDRAVRCLERQSVCVDLAARNLLSAAEARRLAKQIERSDTGPMFVAVLPEDAKAEAGGSAQGVLLAVHDLLGRRGTYAVVAGRSFRAGAARLAVGPLADAALSRHRDEGVFAVLSDFARRVAGVKGGAGSAASDPESGGTASGDGGGDATGNGGGTSTALSIGILALFGLGGGGLFLNARRQRRLREKRELAEVKHVARDDLVALGDDIRALDLDVEVPGVDPTAKADYQRAVELYDQANTAFERARRPQDLAPVTRALEEGRFAMTSARARLNGEPPPEHRAPCFFDPRHGPSVRDVQWAPENGTPRPVPACEADALRVEAGLDPQAREIDVGGRRVAYWNAPAYYGPYSGGFFGGFGGGFVGGLFAGEMLGGWGGQDVFVENSYYGDGGDFSGGGDVSGGGDFGGGGGGDF